LSSTRARPCGTPRVLVTGATGFIGRQCLQPLVDRSFEVHAVSSRCHVQARRGVTWHRTDLLDERAAAELIEALRPTHLLHAAWIMSGGRSTESAENFDWVTASLGLVDAFARHGGRRLVVTGSCFEYDLHQGFCSEERTPLASASVYATCKNALRSLLEAYARSMGLSMGWARIFFVYGPHEHPDRLVGSVATSLLRGQPAPCSHGAQLRDYLHVADVGSAVGGLVDGQIEGVVNVASGTPVSLRDIIFGIARRLGGEELVRLGERSSPADDPPLIAGDVRRLNQELGWRPRFGLEEGLDDAAAWWSSTLKDGGEARQAARLRR
jgi:nucleoside-diphosphate-sugar epimerase